MTSKKAVHPVLRNLHWIIGKWNSISAEAYYPTMLESVKFKEELEFQSQGQPLLSYSSITKHPKSGNLMHLEKGFLKVDDDYCTLALLTAMNFGVSTLEEGYVEGQTVHLTSVCIGIMKFAKQTILAIHRSYRLNERGELEYTLLVETPQTPLSKHVEAVFIKESHEALKDIEACESSQAVHQSKV